MDFSFNESQQAIKLAVQKFAQSKIAPGYAERELSGEIPRALIESMGEMGFIGVDLPESLGGLGADSVMAGIVIEEISRADINVGYVQLLASLNGSVLANHALPEMKAAVVPAICRGEAVVALGLTEPRGGSDAARLILRAQPCNGGYRLSGEKTSISLAGGSDYVLLFARTNESKTGAGGISAFIVPLDLEGVSRTHFEDVGSQAVGRGSIFFDDVLISPATLVGSENQGFRQVMQGFDFSRALIGLQVLAAAEASLAETWEYVCEREAFGNPIAKYQGVTEPLAEAETLLQAAKLMCYKTLWLRDQGLTHTKEAAMCKWWAPKVAFETIHQCLLLHGHSGYSLDLPHQQRLRDVMGLQIGDGTAQIQKMIIARETIGRIAVPY
ncbi:MAG: acyl-CoA dehydrogenase family protein [Pseudomonadales bacterium]